MIHAKALEIAEQLTAQIQPYCERVEIAGSLRRQKSEVKDIEIVAVPKYENWQNESFLFAQKQPVNLLHELWAQCRQKHSVKWIKPGVSKILPWQPKPDGKYWRGYLPDYDIKLDLFLSKPDNFGAIFLIRTGSAEFSQAVVTYAKGIGKRCVDGFFTVHGEPTATPTEADVFSLLRLAYIEPKHRTDGQALMAV